MIVAMGLPRWVSGKEMPIGRCVGGLGSIPGSGAALEKEMATHASLLAGESPWAEGPGGLRPVGSQGLTCLSREHTHLHSWQPALTALETSLHPIPPARPEALPATSLLLLCGFALKKKKTA